MNYLICGYHTIKNCLLAKKRKVNKIYILDNSKYKKEFNKHNLEEVGKNFFIKKFSKYDISHQNIAAEINGFEKLDFKDELSKGSIKKIICLNNVTDIRNIGSIIRTAAAFGYDSLVISDRIFLESSPVLNKTASGGIDLINIFSFSNIKYPIEILIKLNFQIVSLSEKSNEILQPNKINDNHMLILGSENEGINENILKLSSNIFKININPKIGSLNVSTTCAAAMAVIAQKY